MKAFDWLFVLRGEVRTTGSWCRMCFIIVLFLHVTAVLWSQLSETVWHNKKLYSALYVNIGIVVMVMWQGIKTVC